MLKATLNRGLCFVALFFSSCCSAGEAFDREAVQFRREPLVYVLWKILYYVIIPIFTAHFLTYLYRIVMPILLFSQNMFEIILLTRIGSAHLFCKNVLSCFVIPTYYITFSRGFFCNFLTTYQRKQSPKGWKFAKFDHPGRYIHTYIYTYIHTYIDTYIHI
jgi:hypothetical protein